MSSPSRPERPQSCPFCRKAARESYAPFCSPGCRDRDLLNWLGDAYRVPGPPAGDRALEGLDSEG